MSEAVREGRRLTFDDAAKLDPETTSGELEEGRLVPGTRNTWRHGEVVANVVFLLRSHTMQHPGFSVSGGDPGTRLSEAPDTLRGPDVGLVSRARRPTGRGVDGWLDGAPDLAVEVAGDSQSVSSLAKKALEYLAAGASMVWVIDPEPQRVVVYTPPNAVSVLGADDTLDGGDVLPGFACRVAELFE